MKRAMLKKVIKRVVYVICLWVSTGDVAGAALKIDITQGKVEPMPIAINSFYDTMGNATDLGEKIRDVVQSDLQSSGLFLGINPSAFLEKVLVDAQPTFSNWRKIGAVALTSGRIAQHGDKITVEFRLWDPAAEQQIEGTAFTLSESSWRRVAHKISDHIYKRLTGEKGYFDTRVVFIAETGRLDKRVKKLAIMDSDGANYKELTDGRDLVLTPRFDPQSQRVIYMSYKKRVPHVYLLELQTGEQKLVGNFAGMSFAPRFSPDGSKAIFSVAQGGATNIHEIDLSFGSVRQLTATPGVINTSPSYSPDGSKVAFNSDRGGRAQLYTMNSNGSDVKRISFGDGTYNSPVWSPRGDFIAFTKSKGGQFYIGVMRPDGSGERLLTASWMDEGPTWSPNGRVIMFSRQTRGAGYKIFAVDVTGYNERMIKTPTDASDPAWSPLLD